MPIAAAGGRDRRPGIRERSDPLHELLLAGQLLQPPRRHRLDDIARVAVAAVPVRRIDVVEEPRTVAIHVQR